MCTAIPKWIATPQKVLAMTDMGQFLIRNLKKINRDKIITFAVKSIESMQIVYCHMQSSVYELKQVSDGKGWGSVLIRHLLASSLSNPSRLSNSNFAKIVPKMLDTVKLKDY